MHSKYSKCWKMRGVSEGFCMQQDWRSTPVKDKIGSSNLALPSFSPKDGNYWVFYCCMTHVCCHFSQVQLFETLWTIACQAPLPMGFSRQEYWSGLPWPLPRDLSNQGWSLCLSVSLHWQEDSLPLMPPGKTFIVVVRVIQSLVNTERGKKRKDSCGIYPSSCSLFLSHTRHFNHPHVLENSTDVGGKA